ncbi:MAG: hypothetical protein LBK60_01465 [Verrucomicrobiales bacterium]|jgi:hypothetical protein|nr:hypothetical protein [Verrucomicrobiales bacterium]
MSEKKAKKIQNLGVVDGDKLGKMIGFPRGQKAKPTNDYDTSPEKRGKAPNTSAVK